eukprot:1500423-Lingulodinium_polyedra.AAC.1
MRRGQRGGGAREGLALRLPSARLCPRGVPEARKPVALGLDGERGPGGGPTAHRCHRRGTR